MGIFWKKEVKKPTDYDRISSWANSVLYYLGKEKKEITYSIAPTARYFVDTYYDGNGLHIVSPCSSRQLLGNYSGLYIDFNGRRVFDNNTFERGLWEEVLEALYDAAPKIKERSDQERKEKEKLLNHQRGLLCLVSDIERRKSIDDLDSSIKIKSTENVSGYYDEWLNSINYSVYYFDDLVFNASVCTFDDNKYYQYTPGPWEYILEDYKRRKEAEDKRKAEEQERNFAQEQIKKLRKIR